MKIKTIQNSPEKQESRQRRLANYQRQFQKLLPAMTILHLPRKETAYELTL